MLPKVIEASTPVPANEIVASNADAFSAGLSECGAVLLRGFGVASEDEFLACVRSVSKIAFDYRGGGSPRSKVQEGVFTSTEYASSQHIPLHIEGSYFTKSPQRIWFYCDHNAPEGGQTPIGDMRQVLKLLPKNLVQEFEAKKLTYITNLHGGDGFGKSWQDAYNTQSRDEAEAYVLSQGYECVWKNDGGMSVKMHAPAVREHSDGREPYWCAQVCNWHWSQQDARTIKALQRIYADPVDYPKMVTFGDGSAIPETHVAEVARVLGDSEVVFEWQSGDVLLLDNEWIAHGRQSFKGARRILVSLA